MSNYYYLDGLIYQEIKFSFELYCMSNYLSIIIFD